MEMSEPERITVAGGGVALCFPAYDNELPLKEPPRRLKRRLLVDRKPTLSVELIEAKLREAGLRRQQYYERLTSKARVKTRSFSWTHPREEERNQRLEAKLNAAEQKRLSILAKEKVRLDRLNKLRHAAKLGLKMRSERERCELSRRSVSKIQQAEANRILILKAYKQRIAARRERGVHSLKQQLMKEKHYKECVRAALLQKRAAAERKRLGLLEAEKTRASARVLQVWKAARSIYSQRETKRKEIKEQLEDRLQKAKKQRAEQLKRRRSLRRHLHGNLRITSEHGEHLSRKLARCWREFVTLKGTTFSLANAFRSLGIDEESAKSLSFEQLAFRIESPLTTKTVKALVDRLESRLILSLATKDELSGLANIDEFLKRAILPRRKGSLSNVSRRESKAMKSIKVDAQSPIKLPRYPVRVLLCAYMIIGHPDVVLSTNYECEVALIESASNFIREFQLLVEIILNGPIGTAQGGIPSSIQTQRTFRSQLVEFDKVWVSYLYQFVQWKSKDAKMLEEDIVKAACQLELSLMNSRKLTLREDGGFNQDIEALEQQILEEQKILKEKLEQLSGSAGVECLEHALSDLRTKYSQARDGNPMQSDVVNVASSPKESLSSASEDRSNLAEDSKVPSHLICSSFQTSDSSSGEAANSSRKSTGFGCLGSDKLLLSENELLVNEIVHEYRSCDTDNVDIITKDQSSLQEKVRETMETAFWDGVFESVNQEKPDFGWVLKLMTEVRDELCEISPQSWKQQIVETIDVDILSQVLISGTLDVDYLGKILEFALVTLQKLSAPVNEDEIKNSHNIILKELAELSQAADKSNAAFALVVAKGLRFVLQEMQKLKTEISKARVRLIEPLIKGAAGMEYLKKAFENRYGSARATSSLPLTRRWLSSASSDVEQEWNEYTDSLSSITNQTRSSQVLLPATLRTGGTISTASTVEPSASTASYEVHPCEGERVDKLVRLGLMKLVSGISGLTLETLPETFRLNLPRLRVIQAQYQKIIVICSSLLVFRQSLIAENLVNTSTDIESMMAECFKQLCNTLDNIINAGIPEIVDTLSRLIESSNQDLDPQKLQALKKVMENMLVKSLQAGNAIFDRVSGAVHLAIRGVVFGGSGSNGRLLAAAALQRIGAALLTDRVLKIGEVLAVMATVSCHVHQEWYEEMLKNE